MATNIMHCQVGECAIQLETSPDVFYPTSTSLFIGRTIAIPHGGRALDLGCGTGILAIVAACKGASSVYAVDIMEAACALTRRNAVRNGVSDTVHVLCGNLFEPLLPVKFDVIMDDVSGVADEVARLSPWYPGSIPTGGYDGTEHVIPMLEQATNYLSRGGSLCFPVASLSNVPKIMQTAERIFGQHLEELARVDFPFCNEFKAHMDRLVALRERGIIDFTTRRSRFLWTLQLYRAWI